MIDFEKFKKLFQIKKLYNFSMNNNYEAGSKGEENEYAAFKDGYTTQKAIDEDLDIEQDWIYHEHLKILEQYEFIVAEDYNQINQDEELYADYMSGKNALIEYQEVIVKNQNDFSEKAIEETAMLKDMFINATDNIAEKVINKLGIQIEDIVEAILNKKQAIGNKQEMLTVRELAEIYAIKEGQQKQLRGRIHNPLPFHQERPSAKITYKISEVEEWISKQKVKRGI